MRLEVIEGPFDDDPPQFPKLSVQLGLELGWCPGISKA
jgi:hypothetical protein